MRTHPPTTTYIGIALTVAGFIAIAVAWDGAANLDYVQGQFPYLISGGVIGMALIVLGVGLMVIQALQADGDRRTAELAQLTASITALRAASSPPDPFDPATTGEYRPRPRTAPAAQPSPAAGADHTARIPAAVGGWQRPSRS